MLTRFGVLLWEHRRQAGMSLHELARRLGLSHVFVLKVENGHKRTLAPKHWPKLCEALPSLNHQLLQDAYDRSIAIRVQVNLPIDADDETVELFSTVTHTFVRKINERSLTPAQISTILGILEDDTHI